MRKALCTMGLLSAILWHTGCKNEAILRPPKNPEVYNLPPDDPRYTNAPVLPNKYLNQDPGAMKDDSTPLGKTGMGGPGRARGL